MLGLVLKKERAPKTILKMGLVHNDENSLDIVGLTLVNAKKALGEPVSPSEEPEIQIVPERHPQRVPRRKNRNVQSSSSRSRGPRKRSSMNQDIICRECNVPCLVETTTSLKQRDPEKYKALQCCSNKQHDSYDTVRIHLKHPDERKEDAVHCQDAHSVHAVPQVYNFFHPAFVCL